MVNFDQHPHTLKYQVVTGQENSVQDEKGNWIQQAASAVEKEIVCRAVPNGKGQQINGVDGEKIDYAFLIYASEEVEIIPVMTIVEIHSQSGLIGSGTVKRMFIGQLNSKIWV